MKLLSLILLLALSSCAQFDGEPGSWSGEIVWQGYPSEEGWIDEIYLETLDCLNAYKPEPLVVIITGWPVGEDGECRGICDFNNSQIVVNDDPLYLDWILRHEFVHWILGGSNELHGTEEMQRCADDYLFD